LNFSIIIPVYNGADTIAALVENLFRELQDSEIEIILVNDGSADNSVAVCREIQQHRPEQVTFVNLSKNFGEHNAVMTGLRYARGNAAVIMDDDFQNPPSEVNRLVAKLEKGFDVVYGQYERKHHSLFRNLGSWFNGMMATVLLKKPKGLYLCSFKAINRFLIDEIIRYTHPYPYIDGLIFRVTRRVGMVTVQHSPRAVGKSNYSLARLVRLWLNMFTNFSILPLRIATILGCITVVFGMVIAALAVYWAFTDPLAPAGWPTLVCAMVIFSGTQLLVLGVIGEYLGRLFLGQNGTPQSIVREVTGANSASKPPTEAQSR